VVLEHCDAEKMTEQTSESIGWISKEKLLAQFVESPDSHEVSDKLGLTSFLVISIFSLWL
jgi:hypothetical protein